VGWGGYEQERVPRKAFVSPFCVKDAKRLGVASGGDILANVKAERSRARRPLHPGAVVRFGSHVPCPIHFG
jgi:hypothetical protein